MLSENWEKWGTKYFTVILFLLIIQWHYHLHRFRECLVLHFDTEFCKWIFIARDVILAMPFWHVMQVTNSLIIFWVLKSVSILFLYETNFLTFRRVLSFGMWHYVVWYVCWHFREMYCLHLQSQRVNWTSNQQAVVEYRGSMFLWNIDKLLSDYIISQKLTLFVITATRPSNIA